MRSEFSTLDICKALGIQRERLRDWMTQGHIKPTHPATGQGTKAIFTRQAVYCVALFIKMINGGFNRNTAKMYIEKMKQEKDFFNFSYLTFQIDNFDGQGFFACAGDNFKEAKDVPFFWPITPKSTNDNIQVWDYLNIINFKKIQKDTDAKLLLLD